MHLPNTLIAEAQYTSATLSTVLSVWKMQIHNTSLSNERFTVTCQASQMSSLRVTQSDHIQNKSKFVQRNPFAMWAIEIRKFSRPLINLLANVSGRVLILNPGQSEIMQVNINVCTPPPPIKKPQKLQP